MTLQQDHVALGAEPETAGRTGPMSALWLVWRQHSLLLISSAFAAALIAVVLAMAAGHLGAVHCVGNPYDPAYPVPRDGCSVVAVEHIELYSWSLRLLRGFLFAPVLVGVLWGAPLVSRELERGTQGLAWGQDLSPRRWLAGKVAVLAALALVIDLPLWFFARRVAESLSRVAPESFGARFAWEPFGTLAPLVLPYTLAALSVGVLLSVLVRRTIPAMVLTAAVCCVLGVGTAALLRPHYRPPMMLRMPLTTVLSDPTQGQDALVLSPFTWVDQQGRPVTHLSGSCSSNDPQCMAAQGVYGWAVVYQPGSREAEFQWIEGGLSLLVAAGCTSLALRLVRRR